MISYVAYLHLNIRMRAVFVIVMNPYSSLPPNSFFRSYKLLTLTVLCNMIRCYFCLSEGCIIYYCCYVKKINLSSFTLIRQKTRSMQLVYAVIINGIQAIPKSYLCNIPLMFTASSSSANEQCRAYDTERAAVSLLPGCYWTWSLCHLHFIALLVVCRDDLFCLIKQFSFAASGFCSFALWHVALINFFFLWLTTAWRDAN